LAGIVLFTMPSPEADTKNPPSVMAAQRRLAVLGYDPGPVDGILGGKTRAAIDAWRDWTGEPDDDPLPRPLLVIDQIAP
jgi:peptidoglycan hydrolase-like protein with peptidoglycan-binding domain